MVNAQMWLDNKYPLEKRKGVTQIYAKSSSLEGELVIRDFPKLEKIICDCNNDLAGIKLINLPQLTYFDAARCQLVKIEIDNCPNVEFLKISNNLLASADFLNSLSPKKLNNLHIHSNNFSEQDLFFLGKFINLEQLYIDNHDEEKFRKNLYNRFIGSLFPLQDLKKLRWLNIANTDLDSGLEYLSDSVRKICLINSWERKDASYLKIKEELEKSAQVLGVNERLQQEEKGEPHFVKDWYRIAPWHQLQDLLLEEKPLVKSLRKQIRELQEQVKELELGTKNDNIFPQNLTDKSQEKEMIEKLEKKAKHWEEKCQRLEEEKKKLSSKPIDIGSIFLYSGDIITIKTDNGKYLKREESFYSKEKTIQTIESNLNSLGESSYFMVEVVKGSKVRLKIPNENSYCKIGESPLFFKKQSSVSFTNDPDRSTLFLVNKKDENKITLQAIDNKQYLARDSKSVIGQEKEDKHSIFSISKESNYKGKMIDNYREEIETIDFDLNKMLEGISPLVVAEKTVENNSDSSQTMRLTINKEITVTKSFNWDHSFSLGAEAKLTAGVPSLVGNELSFRIDASLVRSNNKTISETQSFSEEISIECSPKKRTYAKATIQIGKLDVPFQATVARYFTDQNGEERKYTYLVPGKVLGTHGFKLNSSIEQTALENNEELQFQIEESKNLKQ